MSLLLRLLISNMYTLNIAFAEVTVQLMPETTMEWTDDMKNAAMRDAQRVCDLTAERDLLRELLNELFNAAYDDGTLSPELGRRVLAALKSN